MFKLWQKIVLICVPIIAVASGLLLPVSCDHAETVAPGWTHLSSEAGEIPLPGSSDEQTAALLGDFDQDGLNDFIIGSRVSGPSVLWYRRHATGWTKYLIDAGFLPIEAGGDVCDIDGDGDLDVSFGADFQGNKIWWWENPSPDFNPTIPWTRREIKNSGEKKHHDQVFGDFDGDGRTELVFWNQRANALRLAEIPDNPKETEPWPSVQIFSSTAESEGLTKYDVNGDGKVDLVGGGRWFEHRGGMQFEPHVIDDAQCLSRVAVGQLKAGGWPEVVFLPGDGVGRLMCYEWTGAAWEGQDILGTDVDHGHSLQLADFNQDGSLDIFCGEMRLKRRNKEAKSWIFQGDGDGHFSTQLITQGFGVHEAKVGDLDGDGDVDILGKPYQWQAPRIDVWLNPLIQEQNQALSHWRRHVIDAAKPWKAVFITAADLNRDGLQDIITGGWWYKNPGAPGGTWTRHEIGVGFHNMASAYDFDLDGSIDVLGTQGKGSEKNAAFVWARNRGNGTFTLFDTPAAGDGDFLQGAAPANFQTEDGLLGVALSWHQEGKGIQLLTVPADPATQAWPRQKISQDSQDECLSAADIDGDDRVDLLLGTAWLRNTSNGWKTYLLSADVAPPDRNRLADINGDGRLDAVVGFEAISRPGNVVWYEQGRTAVFLWREHLIASVIGPMSLDVADMDRDGDLDVVVGEHHLQQPSEARLYIFENRDGKGRYWKPYVVYTGDEHHDGTRVVDIDGDGDLDILSIGWEHQRVLLYENRAETVEHVMKQ